ncbi:hypothetical protein K1719_037196 [Acacia pycnantha]|nr:hypothetical protein K1719_037196 [Acacia pycnantha]
MVRRFNHDREYSLNESSDSLRESYSSGFNDSNFPIGGQHGIRLLKQGLAMKKKLQRMKLSPESQNPSMSSSLTSRRMIQTRELELEEVKGFMDLGFIFKKENVCARMMNVVPGLQRLSMHHNNEDKELIDASKAVEGEGDISIKGPYLSEAWLIKRPDSQRLK